MRFKKVPTRYVKEFLRFESPTLVLVDLAKVFVQLLEFLLGD